jgi:hypothetical protein
MNPTGERQDVAARNRLSVFREEATWPGAVAAQPEPASYWTAPLHQACYDLPRGDQTKLTERSRHETSNCGNPALLQ